MNSITDYLVTSVQSYGHGYKNPKCQVVRATKFYSTVPNICGLLVWNFEVTFLAHKTLRRLLDFSKICLPMIIRLTIYTCAHY